jgi:hypothetical protein
MKQVKKIFFIFHFFFEKFFQLLLFLSSFLLNKKWQKVGKIRYIHAKQNVLKYVLLDIKRKIKFDELSKRYKSAEEVNILLKKSSSRSWTNIMIKGTSFTSRKVI